MADVIFCGMIEQWLLYKENHKQQKPKEKMQCPYLQKINFKKINQIVSDDPDCFELSQPSQAGEHRLRFQKGQQNFDFEEESVQNINASNMNKHQLYYFNSKINSPQSTQKSKLLIRYPKQLEAKKMINAYPIAELDENLREESISSQCSSVKSKSIPQVMISKMSMLSSKCEDIFQGEVHLQGEDLLYHCSLKDRAVRISNGEKVRYFVDLEKGKCWMDQVKGKSTRGLLHAVRKDKEISVEMIFASEEKLSGFSRALELNNCYILEQRQEDEQEKLSVAESIDSLGFQVERMQMHQLLKKADTFDIILYKNKTLMSKVQRFFTFSDYDHVAMLIKTSTNNIFLLEATSSAGVAIYAFQTLLGLNVHKFYVRMGYRQYKGDRNDEVLYQLQEFLKEAVGKRYKFDPMYLIKNQAKKEETYFCSELVAASLQRAGIMRNTHQPYKFLPKHFSTEMINEEIVQGSFGETIILQ